MNRRNTKPAVEKDAEIDSEKESDMAAVLRKLVEMEESIDKKLTALQTALELKIDLKIDTKLAGMQAALVATLETKFKTQSDALSVALTSKIKEVAASTKKEMTEYVDQEVKIMVTRMEDIEGKQTKESPRASPFDPDLSLIIVGLPLDNEESEEDLKASVIELLRNGLECAPVPEVVAVERLRSRGERPGVVKVELRSVQEKVTVLRLKRRLKDNDNYRRVYMSAAKSHAERLVDINFRTLLKAIPEGKQFFLTGNGRLVQKATEETDS